MRRLAAALLRSSRSPPRPPPPGAAATGTRQVRDARAFADARRGEVAFAVRTRTRAWGVREGVQYRSASVVKAMLLVAYLRRADVRGRALRAGERALLDPMIRFSDNRAADRVHARVGLPALAALAGRAGMRAFVPHPVWGGSLITAGDQAGFFRRIDRLVPARHRDYAMGLLRGIIAGQRWGLAGGAARGLGDRLQGRLGEGRDAAGDPPGGAADPRGGMRVSVAILTADNPSTPTARRPIRGVARRLLRGLEERPVGRVLPLIRKRVPA